MDIGDVVAVFEAAFLAGGATAAYCPSHETRRCATHPRILTQATLSLLDRDPFAAATRTALRATGRSSEVAINATVQVGCGILYHGAAGPQEDVVGVVELLECSSPARRLPWSGSPLSCAHVRATTRTRH